MVYSFILNTIILVVYLSIILANNIYNNNGPYNNPYSQYQVISTTIYSDTSFYFYIIIEFI